jgi:hypothetical protein
MIYKGDVGVILNISTLYNITGYTSIKIYFISPNGTITSVTPDTITPATGALVYTTKTETELNAVGTWTIQVVVWFGTNAPMFSDIASFTVLTPPSNPTGAII